MYRAPPLIPFQQHTGTWAETWMRLDDRLVIYTASPLDEPCSTAGTATPPARDEVYQIQDQVVLDSVTYHLLVDQAGSVNQDPGTLLPIRRVFVRDHEGTEGTMNCLCEPYEQNQWLVTLDEQVENRVTGALFSFDKLVFPIYLCFCRLLPVRGEERGRVIDEPMRE